MVEGVLSVGALLGCLLLLYAVMVRRGIDRGRSVLIAGPIFGVVLTSMTEVLSLFHGLGFVGILVGWVGVDSILVGWLLVTRTPVSEVRRRPGSIGGESGSSEYLRTGVWAFVGFVVIFVGLLGLIVAPANWDSMTYHLPRVMHWMQDRSVGHYPTNCLAQLYQGPGAEFVLLHLQVLWGMDRLAFSPQWFAMIGCLIGVVVLARRLGAGAIGQWMGAVFVVTLPSGILQGQSTQNNYVLAFWMVCWANAIFELREAKGWLWPAFLVGATVGLAVLTKGTTYMLGLPLVVWFCVEAVKRGWERGARVLVVAGVLAVLLNAGHWVRNYREFGSPLVPRLEAPYLRVNAMSLPLFTSNVLRNLALIVATPSQVVNDAMVRGVVAVDHLMGVDPNDSRVTFPGRVFAVPVPHESEDLTGNPLHLLLLVVVGIVVMITARRSWPAVFLGIVLAGFVVFCLSLKWQPFHARLQLPLFVLAGPAVGAVLEKMVGRWGGYVVAMVLFVAAVPAMVSNPSRPISGPSSIFSIPREQQYFANFPGLYSKYERVVEVLVSNRCENVGFVADRNGWEYPLWVLMEHRTGHWPVVWDLTDQTMGKAVGMDAVVVLNSDRDRGKLPDGVQGWKTVHIDDQIVLFLR